MPVKLIKITFGQNKVIPNTAKIKDFIKIGKIEISRIVNLYIEEKYVRIKREKINYFELAKEYRGYLDSGEVKNQAELARKLNVSRAWVTKVLTKKQLQND